MAQEPPGRTAGHSSGHKVKEQGHDRASFLISFVRRIEALGVSLHSSSLFLSEKLSPDGLSPGCHLMHIQGSHE